MPANLSKNISERIISRDDLSSIPNDVLQGLTLLKFLDMRHNKIKVIAQSAFQCLPLETAYFGDTLISTISPFTSVGTDYAMYLT